MPYGKKDWAALIVDDDEPQEALIEGGVLEDLTFDVDQVKALAATSLDWLAAMAMPTVFVHPFPDVLKSAWALLVQSTKNDSTYPQIALGIPRGHAKTTLIKLFILHCILFTDKSFILITAATASLAENIMADISDMLDEPNIRKVFGDWTAGRELNRQDLKKFGYRGRPIILAAIGAGGALRGLNIKNERPDVIVMDDLQTKECSESPLQSNALERWMIGTLMKAKSPKGCLFIFSGNMYPGPDSILKRLKTNDTWTKFIMGAILEDGTALWPELRSYDSLIQELNNDIAMGHPEIFFAEVLNDTEAGINTTTDLALIKDWPWPAEDIAQGNFIIIDPSTNKLRGDFTAIGYFEIYDETPALKEIQEARMSPKDTINRALLLALQKRVKVIAVESTAYQYSLLFWFQEIAEALELTGFLFVPVYTGNRSKNARIQEMLKSLTSGDIVIHPSVKSQVTNQIAQWSPLRRDNIDGILDLLTYAPKVLELYGADTLTDLYDEIQGNMPVGVLEDNSCI